MYGQGLAALPGALHDRRIADIGHLVRHIQLAQAVATRCLIRDRIQFVGMAAYRCP